MKKNILYAFITIFLVITSCSKDEPDRLFQRFMDVQRTFFIKNPRMRMLINTYDKMQNDKKTEMRTIAEKYLQSIE